MRKKGPCADEKGPACSCWSGTTPANVKISLCFGIVKQEVT